ncbi:DUF551 domain-containing protein [Klebsiella pneumoniae]|uniref:DUF551 domain-containing protein n=1 Tax=Klebsiella pneumoniae TaxID=573 RepID=UPI002AB4CB9E|nr:DUF551 domain-containing protein [Klebsiella pneumoniae]MDY7671099.1 DUF551 domain-containing protein [Klebsiella pneumoniae]MDY7767011.1 DUF551 domain-containing protein [Klebsiella pneumoniae]
MSEFSRETLLNIIETDHVQCGDASALARMALAAMDSEPVAEVYQTPNVGICAALGPSIRMLCALEPGTKLYLHAQPAPVVPGKWIPVSERMPDNTEPVLCIEKRADFGTYGQPFVCWHDGGGWVGKTNYRPIVTHWMPLPADPQEVK